MQHKLSNTSWIQHAEVLALYLFIWMTFSSSADHKRNIEHIYDNCLAGSKSMDWSYRYQNASLVSMRLISWAIESISRVVFPLPEKVDAIRSFPTPTTVKQLQEYLGMVNFYHRFVPSAAALMQLLYQGHRCETQTTGLDV